MAGLAAVVVGWTSYLQMRIAVLDVRYANGDPGAGELYLACEISAVAGVIAAFVFATRRRWVAAVAAAILTPVACMALSWCIGNAAFVLVR